MATRRFLIILVWITLHGGGLLFLKMMQMKMQQWEDLGMELPWSTVALVWMSDLLVRYWYFPSLLLTAVCVVMWGGQSSKTASKKSD